MIKRREKEELKHCLFIKHTNLILPTQAHILTKFLCGAPRQWSHDTLPLSNPWFKFSAPVVDLDNSSCIFDKLMIIIIVRYSLQFVTFSLLVRYFCTYLPIL